MPAEATVSASVRRLPFSRIDSFPALFQDYCGSYEKLAAFFAGDFRDADERRKAVDRALSVERDRSTLADVLTEQNKRWGLDDKARANIEALRQEDSAAVVTGQQVGIFGGPIFTVLKALTTVQLAEQLTEETGRPVVPVFWIGAEDHDFEEIASVYLLRRNEPVALRYGDAPPGNPGPVGRIQISEEIDRLIGTIDEVLPPTDFKPDVMRFVRESYQTGSTLADAFAVMIRQLFAGTGLVLLNSDDKRLKQLAAPLFKREIIETETVARVIGETSEKLREAYHEQVQVRPANLFFLGDNGRFAIDLDGADFHLRDQSRSFTRDELTDLVDASPELFSPNVVLRPLMQDVLLPTAAYVGGPGEISYYAQYKQVYEWAGLPMPLIYPRASVTLMESKVSKVLEKYDLTVGDFGKDLDRLFQRVVVASMEVNVDDLFKRAGRHLHEAVNAVKPGLEQVDRTLVQAAEASRSALADEFEKLKGKVVRAEKKNQEIVRGQLEKAQANLFPEGTLQERTLSILYFLNKYSPALLAELRSVVSTDTTEHQIVEL